VAIPTVKESVYIPNASKSLELKIRLEMLLYQLTCKYCPIFSS
jgi:hypothetical protein